MDQSYRITTECRGVVPHILFLTDAIIVLSVEVPRDLNYPLIMQTKKV